jgi:superfamily II DNA or RNA helicase
MDRFPNDIAFRLSWRPYQQRVLEELNEHLDDNHLHVIAAPGSGKTILGLEVSRLLNQPTLIFAPTLAIRDQWVDRFVNFFCTHRPEIHQWISKDIRRPKFLTVSTYQGLHSAYVGKIETEGEEPEDELPEEWRENNNVASRNKTEAKHILIDELKRIDIHTIVVDEAHHLRSEWWKCLIDIKQQLNNPTIVALTATPPYDVTPQEWQRYQELCGPVDAEIYVPELVQEKNLCPHQDYVYVSTPLQEEENEINEFHRNVEMAYREICADSEFARALASLPAVQNPQQHIKTILDDPGFYSTIAIFLRRIHTTSVNQLCRIIGIDAKSIPPFNLELMEVLLTGCLYTQRKRFAECEDLFTRMTHRLKRIGVIEKRSVRLTSTSAITKLLVTSCSKLQSIREIVKLESESLGHELRLVVLTDFIRREDLPKSSQECKPLKRLGVVPIFETLRRSNIPNIRLGVLSGSLVVIPRTSCELLESIAAQMGLDIRRLKITALPCDPDYLSVDITGQDQQKIVSLITRLFNQGGVTVLVGTKSLLGEGWDAPSINTLILASFVGSYMLSNQMRGRAIRVQSGNPQKTANIWHLICVEVDSTRYVEDLNMLTRRFKAFVGVSFLEPVIENGLERLAIGDPPFTQEKINRINTTMQQNALARMNLHRDWFLALATDAQGQMVEEIACSPRMLPRPFVLEGVTLSFIRGAVWIGLIIFAFLMKSTQIFRETLGGFWNLAWILIMSAGAIGTLKTLPKTVKALLFYLRHRSETASIRQIGKVLLQSLIETNIIHIGEKKPKVVTRKKQSGSLTCTLRNVTTFEKSAFLNALEEMFSPIQNPRYLLYCRSFLGRLGMKDYYPVPQILGRNKETAQKFQMFWARYIGRSELLYTRSLGGRETLLKARGKDWTADLPKQTERVRTWK